MKITLSIVLAAIYGLIIRLMFGFLSDVLEIMSISFLFILPSLIGFLTIIFLPVDAVRNQTRAFFLPWLTSLLLLIITILVDLEGVDCWVMVYPFFSAMAGVGGLIAYQVKLNKLKKSIDNSKLKLSLLAILPLFAGVLERDASSATSQYQLSRSVVIDAPSTAVWNKLTHIGLISSNENRSLFTDVVGFPRHTSTAIDNLIVGGHRKAIFEKELYFDEVITELKPLQLLTVAIKAEPEKIPPNVLDEHVVVGGRHISILSDSYQLTKLPNNKCILKLTSTYTICTPFNWYAEFWANIVISDILKSELSLIRNRAISKNM